MIMGQMPPVPPTPPFIFERHDWLPVGVVLAFAGLIDPVPTDHQTNVEAWGWMVCDGRKLETGAYPELYAVLGCLYGEEEAGGKSFFYLPDYRGYFQRGVAIDAQVDKGWGKRCKNPGPGSTGSDNGLGSVEEGMVQMHEHRYENYPGGGAAPGQPPGSVNPSTPTQHVTTELYTDSSGAKNLSGEETRPVNIAVNYIIKYAYLGRPSHLYR